MRFYGFDWTYLVFILPCVLLSLFCQIKVSSAFSKYSQVPNSRRMTGAQAAEYVLRQNGVYFAQTSVAAVGVAAHEAGHAVQHAQNYLPNKIRGVLVPVANIGSKLSWILIMLGLIFYARIGTVLLYIGIILFSASVLFTVVTLPVEFDASRRALKCFRDTNLLAGDEYKGAKSVLQAAAMTYVASAVTAIMQLLRLLLIARRRN